MPVHIVRSDQQVIAAAAVQNPVKISFVAAINVIARAKIQSFGINKASIDNDILARAECERFICKDPPGVDEPVVPSAEIHNGLDS